MIIMGNEAPTKRIGIGPPGKYGGLIQFIVFWVLCVVFLTYLLPTKYLVNNLLPATLFMLVTLGHLTMVGDGWPFSPPAGRWRPGKSRFWAGFGLTICWIVFTFAMILFARFIYPKWVLGPNYLWFGVVGFWATLQSGVIWGGWPYKGRMHPWAAMFTSFLFVVLTCLFFWFVLMNLDGTPMADTPSNHHGPFGAGQVVGFLVFAIAWTFVFGPIFTTQGTFFGKLRMPYSGILQTILAHVVAFITYYVPVKLGVNESFWVFGVGASWIFWPLVHSWHLQYWGVRKVTGIKRAVGAFVIQVVLVIVWVVIMRLILGPMADRAAELGVQADVYTFITWVNLCILAPALIFHNSAWMRWPLTMPTPPGVPARDVAVDDREAAS